MDRFSRLLVATLCLAAVAVIGTAFVARGPRAALDGNTLGNPPGMEDRLVLTDTADAFERGDVERDLLVCGKFQKQLTIHVLQRVEQNDFQIRKIFQQIG